MDPGGSSFPLAEIAFTVCLQLWNVNVWRNEIQSAALASVSASGLGKIATVGLKDSSTSNLHL
jgi:hypothetical protein